MNAREIYNAIQTGNRQDSQQALFGLLGQIQALTTAVLEVAGSVKLKSKNDPLSSRSRLLLTEFLDLQRTPGFSPTNRSGDTSPPSTK